MTRFPWQERNGRFSPLKAACFAALFLPALWVLGQALLDDLGPRPVTEAIHELGLWTIRLLFLTLAITPLRLVWRWPQLILLRRMIGVAVFCYALAHVSGYVVDPKLHWRFTPSLRTFRNGRTAIIARREMCSNTRAKHC